MKSFELSLLDKDGFVLTKDFFKAETQEEAVLKAKGLWSWRDKK